MTAGSKLKSAARAIQHATGWSYQASLNQLRQREDNGKTLDENAADIIDDIKEHRRG